MSAVLSKARRLLKSTFGYQDFIGKQAEIVEHILQGGNTLALMPTGGGKSLCYQLPALLLDGTAIVVSPLIALMKDQVDSMAQYNIRTAALNSSLGTKETRLIKQQLLNGDLDLLYIAPERLMGADGLALIRNIKISLIAIDEAHCISQWGHDFRPQYLQLSQLADEFVQVPRLALTATADSQTRQEIIDKLQLHDGKVIVSSFDRSNINYRILTKENTREQFLKFYRSEHQGQSGIIYCLSRRRTEETAQWLETQGVAALPYHAGMSSKTRDAHQEQFLHQDSLIICATVAFGMGINKPDVRFVAHFDLPKSLEGYYQETGRAGRDGLPANAVLFYGLGDAVNVRKLLEDSNAPAHIRRIEQQKLNMLIAFCEAHSCRRALLLEYFDEAYQPPCNNCDNCQDAPQLIDGTVAAQKFLSAVIRSRQLFGVTHIIDILTGKKTDKILKFSHDQLPTYGAGGEHSAAQWRRIARQLVIQGLVQPDDQHGSLKLTAAGNEVLRGNRTVEIRQEQKKEQKTRTRTARTPRTQPDSMLDELQLGVYEALREERRRLALSQKIPAYIIFHDTVLIELSRTMPETEQAFAQTSGVGEAKAKRYAKAFIKIIKQMRYNE